MKLTVYIVILLLIATKLCDVVSTLKQIKSAYGETNSIVRQMMLRFGIMRSVWIVFVLALLIIGLSATVALEGNLLMQVSFVIAGSVISVVQGAVAYCNWTGRDNVVSGKIRRLHSVIHWR